MRTNRFSKIFCLFVVIFLFLEFPVMSFATDYRLWYSSPALSWKDQCLPIGNGGIGAMIYGGVATEQLQFNEITLWQGGTTAESTGNYMGFGDLFVDVTVPGSSSSNYRRDLDIGEATAHVSYTAGGFAYNREYFCSFPDSVLVGHFTCVNPGQISILVRVTPLAGLTSQTVAASGNVITFSGYQNSGADLANLNFEAQVYVKNYKGALAVEGANVRVTAADSVDIIFAAATDFKQASAANWRGSLPHDIVTARLSAASAQSYASLRSKHVTDYQGLFNRFSLDLKDSISKGTATATRRSGYQIDKGGDRGLDVLFTQYGRYLLIAGSRVSLPVNLQGLWNNSASPPWRSDYHSDINLTMNYSHAEPLNIAECMIPFVNFVDAQRGVRHTRTATKYPGVRGWTVQTETNPMGGNSWNWNNPGSAWYCNLLWDHFQFGLDTAYLRQTALPIMKEVCQFWQDHLVMQGGALVTPDGWSPENTVGIEAAVSYDQQLVWDVFTNYSKAEDICNADPAFHHTIDSLLKILDPGLRIGAKGDLQEWKADKQGEQDHRHLSHLVCVYPGSQVSPFVNTTYANAAKQALTLRGDGSTGWSCAWRADCWARLLDGAKAYHQFGLQMKNFVYGNLLDNCNDVFQIDGNCGAPAAVAEMLIQSHTDEIVLLPALPALWPAGSVRGLRARGAFRMDIDWAAGVVTGSTLYSEKGADCRLRMNPTSVTVTCDGQKVTTSAVGATDVQFATVAGRSYKINGGALAAVRASRPFSNAGFTCQRTAGRWYLTFPSDEHRILTILDLRGKIVFSQRITGKSFTGNLKLRTGLSVTHGTYLIQISGLHGDFQRRLVL